MPDEKREYEKIGFLCGLEIHQRLATEQKLFCNCQARLSDDVEEKHRIFRYQRAVAGELGSVDRSAKFEAMKNRKFVYNVDDEHACLVDIDEEPPHRMNREALGTALAMAKALGMIIVDELQPMRKEVVDGSNPSAFQRTTKIGLGGHLKLGEREVNVISIFLEEESAGIEKAGEGEILYNTDRIGIPLIEIDTDPNIKTPKEAKEVALRLGTLLRISGKVQRGIGSIRQDVNVSIAGGARVEIKGLQELDTLDRFVENEVARQQALLKIKALLEKRKGAGVMEQKDLTRLFKGSDAKIIKGALDKGGVVIGFRAAGFAEILGTEVNPGRRFGTEVSDYAKMGGVNGIIHSDEKLDAYGLTDEEVKAVKKELMVKEGDAFVMIAGNPESAKKAAMFAMDRIKYAGVGVPVETRAATGNENCTTRFMRPLPGGSRMYPETDAVPIPITKEMLEEAEENSPDLEKLRSGLMSELKSKLLVDQLLLSPRLPLFRSVSSRTSADKEFIANTLLQKFTELKRSGVDVDRIGEEELARLFELYAKGAITKKAADAVLEELAKGGDAEDVVKKRGLSRISGKELQVLLKREFPGKQGADLVREVMIKYRLRVDGEELNEILK